VKKEKVDIFNNKQVMELFRNSGTRCIISDYLENPQLTFFVNSLENSTISILCVKNLRKIGHFEICFLSIYIRAWIEGLLYQF
jgi:hypothetical protein